MSPPRRSREQARNDVDAAIMRIASEQLAEVGAAALSLRAVARELGMVSSAVYRYVESRDELLTRLIDDAYNSLGDAVERDVAATSDAAPAERWTSAARVIRAWAHERPHEYTLLYGSPVPGYAAPELTAASGTRASLALMGIVRDAARDRRLRRPRRESDHVGPALADDLALLGTTVGIDIGEGVLLDVLMAWTDLFGLLSFELFNQTRGVVTHHADLFEAAARRHCDHIGFI